MTYTNTRALNAALNLIEEELTPAQTASLWLLLGAKLANYDQHKLVQVLSKIVMKDFDKSGPYSNLISAISKMIRNVSIQQIIETNATQNIHDGKMIVNPILIGNTIGEA